MTRCTKPTLASQLQTRKAPLLAAWGLLMLAGVLLSPSHAFAVQLSPTSLSFVGTENGAASAKTVTFWKFGSQQNRWTAASTVPWLSAAPSSGIISTERDQVQATVNPSGLAPGFYSTSLMITTSSRNGNIRKTAVPVSLTVTAARSNATLNFSPALPSFTGTVGGSNPAPQTMALSSSDSALSWTATDNVPWLSLSPTSGSTPGSLIMTVSTAGLSAGTYSGLITMTAPNATNSTQYMPVTLTVTASTSTPAIGLSPSSLSFSGTVGGANPSAQPLTVANTGSGTLTWTASDNANWLTLSPSSGTNTATVSASVNLSGLAAGTYNATVTLAATGATTKTVPVTLTLTASSASSATLLWSANADTDLAGYKVYRSTASGTYGAAVATLGQTVTSYVSSGLQTGTTYFFVITAYDSAGNESPFSNEVSKSIF